MDVKKAASILSKMETDALAEVLQKLDKAKKKLPIEDFLKRQGRFKHLFKPGNEELIVAFQAEVDRRWEELLERCHA